MTRSANNKVLICGSGSHFLLRSSWAKPDIMDIHTSRPLFSAVSSSARQLFLLLRCISFAHKAQVQIAPNGLRFMAEESQVMQGRILHSLSFDSNAKLTNEKVSSSSRNLSSHHTRIRNLLMKTKTRRKATILFSRYLYLHFLRHCKFSASMTSKIVGQAVISRMGPMAPFLVEALLALSKIEFSG